MRRLLLCAAVLTACATPAPASPETSPPSPPQPPPTSAEPSPTSTAPARKITISGSGDILIHPSLWAHAQADGLSFEPALAGARGAIKRVDYAICHVEQGFNDPDGPETEYPDYFTHPILAEGIASTGFDACSRASNWTWLKGLDGIARTNSALRKAGLSPAGSRAKPGQSIYTMEDVSGVRVAHLSFTDPADSAVPGAEWSVNRGGARDIIKAAEQARSEGAEVVVVSLAMGQMGDLSVSADQQRTVRAIARSGEIDLVIGHGSHTIQGAQEIDGMWVVWHGNLLSSFFPDQLRMHEGLVSTATLSEQPDGRFRVSKIGGEVVLSLPQSGRVIDVSRQSCDRVPPRWQEAYYATRQTLRPAIAQGFVLRRPCEGE